MSDATSRPNKTSAIAITALVLALAAVLVAVFRQGARPQSDQRNTLREALSRKEIRATVVPIPPLVIIDPNTKAVSGMAPDILEAIAAKSGMKVTFSVADWGNMGSELTSGKSDMVCSGVFLTVDRAKEFSFSVPFSYWGMVPVVRTDDQRIKTKQDLRVKGLKVAALRGEAGFQWATKNMPEAQITPMTGSDLTQPMMEVATGRADVAFGDLATARRFAAEHKEVKVLFELDPLDVYAAGFMLRQGDPQLQEFLNVGLQQLNSSGELETIENKYAAQKSWMSMPKPWK